MKRNARKIYLDYFKKMNNEDVVRELIAYQDYGDSFAIIEITTKSENNEWKDYMITRIDYCCEVEPIRTYGNLMEAKIALLALAYKSYPIIELPF